MNYEETSAARKRESGKPQKNHCKTQENSSMIDSKVSIISCPTITRDKPSKGKGNRGENGRKSSKAAKEIEKESNLMRPIKLVEEEVDILADVCGSREAAEQFKAKHFQKHPFVIRGCKQRVELLNKSSFYNLNTLTYLKNTASDQIHVWLAPSPSAHDAASSSSSSTLEKAATDGDYPAAPVLNSISVDDPNTAHLLYIAGHSLYCRAPAQVEAAVITRALEALGIGVCSSGNDRFRRGEIETFFTRAHHKTDFHCDFQENITIQLAGTKKWIFRKSHSMYPIRGCTPHFNSNAQGVDVAETQLKTHRLCDTNFQCDSYKKSQQHQQQSISKTSESVSHYNSSSSKKKVKKETSEISSDEQYTDEEHEVTIHAGDVLYHPAGIWHRVECVEDSVSINISLIGTSYADVICSGIQQLLWEHPQWRRPVQVNSSSNHPAAVTTVNSLLSSLSQLLSKMKAQDFLPFVATLPVSLSAAVDEHSDGGVDGVDGVAGAAIGTDASKLLGYHGVAIDAIADCNDDGDEGEEEEEEEEDEEMSDSQSEEEEVEEEEAEDDVDEDDNKVGVSENSSITKLYIHETELPAGSRLVRYLLESVSFRCNPLTRVFFDREIYTFGCSSASYVDVGVLDRLDIDVEDVYDCRPIVLIVHSCFGNETLESVTRGIVYAHPKMTDLVNTVLERIKPKSSVWQVTNVAYASVDNLSSASQKRKISELTTSNINDDRLASFFGKDIVDSLTAKDNKHAAVKPRKSESKSSKEATVTDQIEKEVLQVLLTFLKIGILTISD